MKSKILQRHIFGPFNKGRSSNFGLRMAPMIDMIFLLLIFFLVAAKWRPEESFLPMQLPVAQAQSHSVGEVEPLIIHICDTPTGCRVKIGRRHVQIKSQNIDGDLLLLVEQLRQCLREQKRFAADPVEIVCDAAVKWDHLAKIYNVFFGAGLTDITFRMTE